MAGNTKFAWLVVVGSVLLMIWLRSTTENDFKSWLVDQGLSELEEPLRNIGIVNLEDLLKASSQSLEIIAITHPSKIDKLKSAIEKLQLKIWLEQEGLLKFEKDLKANGIYSLEMLSHVRTDEIVQRITSKSDQKRFMQSLTVLRKHSVSKSIQTEPTVKYSYGIIVVLLYLLSAFLFLIGLYFCCVKILEVVAITVMAAILHIIWMIVVGTICVIIQGLTGRSIRLPDAPNFFRASNISNTSSQSSDTWMTRTRPPNDFRLGLYDRITGRNVDLSKCLIEWNHKDITEVGKSSVASVHFHSRNGKPYKLQPSDSLQVSIVHVTSWNIIPHVIEPATIIGSNTIKVSFITRLSGDYTIDIKLNGTRIGTKELIRRMYKPGTVDASKTVFLQQSNTIVVTAALYHSMQIIPKDGFGNTALISQEFLTAEIRKGGVNGEIINPECVIDRVGGNQYEILLKVEQPGHYVGCVKYEGNVIGPQSITIISLSESDSATVDRNVAKKCNVYYEAQLQTSTKPKRVYCYPTSKQIQIKEYFFMGIFPKRLYTCKVSPLTRIVFHEDSNSFTIDDGYQSPICLSSPHREILAATFYKFLLKNIGGSEKFQDKQTFFYNEVKKLKSYHTRGEMSFTITRDNLLECAMSVTRNLNSSDWYKKFSISFQGEEGLDWGGVSREFFELVCVRCFDPTYKLFQRFSDNPQALVHPNPKRPSHLKLKHFEFAGRVIGKCLYESSLGNPLMVKARFSRSFLAQIIGLRINHKYFESDNPELYTTKIQYIRDNDVTDLGLVFAEEEFDSQGGSPTIVPLIDKGDEIEVTNQNKIQYLNLLAQHNLAKCVRDEVEHFLKGLNEIIPEHLLSIFDENELELLMCGMGTVNYNDLKIHAVVNGSSDGFRNVVSWFWNIVSGFTQEEMAKLVQFVTGCSQLPPGGFRDLSPPFQIISSPTHGRLPTAHTCFNQICLPNYDSYEQFQQSLNLALNEGSEGFGFA